MNHTHPAQAVRFRDIRLRNAAEFDRVFAENQRARSEAYLVMALPNQVGHARLGLVIGKRQLPRAVDRNRVKRCARAGFRRIFSELPACDFVVRLLAAPTPGSEQEEIVRTLRRTARRVRERWPEAPASAHYIRPSHG